jgi:hypothetical protein
VLIQGDWFFGLWRRGAIDPWRPEAGPQTTVAAAAAAATAGTFARADCTVVYDGFIPPPDLADFAALAGLAAIHYAVLLPPEGTCVARVASRTGHGFNSDDATRRMYRDFAGATLDARHVFYDAEEAPPQIAAQIRDEVSAGRLLWTAPGGQGRAARSAPPR